MHVLSAFDVICKTNFNKGMKSNFVKQEEKDAEISLLMTCHTKKVNAKDRQLLGHRMQ